MKLQKNFQIITVLALIQAIRIGLKAIVFLVVDRTLLSDTLVNCTVMLLLIAVMCVVARKKQITLNLFPKKITRSYTYVTVGLLLCMFLSPIVTQTVSIYHILFLLYGAILTVIFEEFIFRGYLWNQLEQAKNKNNAYLLTTIFFSLWQLSYIDTFIWRSTIFFPNIGILSIVFGQVVIAFLIGLLVGYCRYHNQNVYSSMLLHSFINLFRL